MATSATVRIFPEDFDQRASFMPALADPFHAGLLLASQDASDNKINPRVPKGDWCCIAVHTLDYIQNFKVSSQIMHSANDAYVGDQSGE